MAVKPSEGLREYLAVSETCQQTEHTHSSTAGVRCVGVVDALVDLRAMLGILGIIGLLHPIEEELGAVLEVQEEDSSCGREEKGDAWDKVRAKTMDWGLGWSGRWAGQGNRLGQGLQLPLHCHFTADATVTVTTTVTATVSPTTRPLPPSLSLSLSLSLGEYLRRTPLLWRDYPDWIGFYPLTKQPLRRANPWVQDLCKHPSVLSYLASPKEMPEVKIHKMAPWSNHHPSLGSP